MSPTNRGIKPMENDASESEINHKSITVKKALSLAITLLVGIAIGLMFVDRGRAEQAAVLIQAKKHKLQDFDNQIGANSQRMMEEGREIFRFDTFGDEAFGAIPSCSIGQSQAATLAVLARALVQQPPWILG
jgi:hypothetical protein